MIRTESMDTHMETLLGRQADKQNTALSKTPVWAAAHQEGGMEQTGFQLFLMTDSDALPAFQSMGIQLKTGKGNVSALVMIPDGVDWQDALIECAKDNITNPTEHLAFQIERQKAPILIKMLHNANKYAVVETSIRWFPYTPTCFRGAVQFQKDGSSTWIAPDKWTELWQKRQEPITRGHIPWDVAEAETVLKHSLDGMVAATRDSKDSVVTAGLIKLLDYLSELYPPELAKTHFFRIIKIADFIRYYWERLRDAGLVQAKPEIELSKGLLTALCELHCNEETKLPGRNKWVFSYNEVIKFTNQWNKEHGVSK